LPPAFLRRDSSITRIENGSEKTSPSTFSSSVLRLKKSTPPEPVLA
jgi:hypothetical protein